MASIEPGYTMSILHPCSCRTCFSYQQQYSHNQSGDVASSTSTGDALLFVDGSPTNCQTAGAFGRIRSVQQMLAEFGQYQGVVFYPEGNFCVSGAAGRLVRRLATFRSLFLLLINRCGHIAVYLVYVHFPRSCICSITSTCNQNKD